MTIKSNFMLILLWMSQFASGQVVNMPHGIGASPLVDSTPGKGLYNIGNLPKTDTVPIINFPDVNILTFKTNEEWLDYYRTRARILKVMPYVKVAKELYTELQEKEDTSSRRQFRRYRKDVEKEMRSRFEAELKDLTISEGKTLFKLINRETGNNSYRIIKELKGSIVAWFYQQVARHWGYDLKENYDPKNEKMIELIIKELGPAYRI